MVSTSLIGQPILVVGDMFHLIPLRCSARQLEHGAGERRIVTTTSLTASPFQILFPVITLSIQTQKQAGEWEKQQRILAMLDTMGRLRRETVWLAALAMGRGRGMGRQCRVRLKIVRVFRWFHMVR